MKITKEINDELMEWIKDSEDTNDYCNRSLIVDAMKCLDKDPPEVDKALSRLFEVSPIGGTKLIRPPDFIKELENADKGKKET